MDDSKAAPPGLDRSVADTGSDSPRSQHTVDPTDPARTDSSSPAESSMALVAPNNPTILAAGPGPGAGVNKRYRPAPAKTFQCRGYGDCRMVFSRSEHLARHIRKHTGERPFACHCSKQFSRLDNLRQHAQTVHADKQEQNERMMRDLTSLHASMAAANKAGQPRGKRSQNALNAATLNAASSSAAAHHDAAIHTLDTVKEEDMGHSVPPIHYRPGTSTGYEGTDTLMYNDWSADAGGGGTHPHPRPANNHSFRDSSQSFRAPPTSASSSFFNTQSFLPLAANSSPFNFSVPATRDGRPGSSSSRPATAGAPAPANTEPSSASHARTLPPLAAVVSASIPTTPSQQPPSAVQPFASSAAAAQHVLPLPGTAAFARRPHTAGRPGTAPASFFVPSKPAYAGGPGLVHQPELSLPPYGRSAELAAAAAAAAANPYHHHHHPGASASYEGEPPSPTAAAYDSPFSFNPPPPVPEPAPAIPRKRPFSGLDHDDASPSTRRELLRPGSSSGLGDYEYGTESRPQSRRLSVLELCNDTDVDAALRPFLSGPAAPGTASRPTTSSGLCTSASALALVDRSPPTPSPSLLPGAQAAAAAAAPSAAPAAQTSFSGGRLSPGARREPTASPSPAYPAAAAGAGGILRAIPGPDPASSPSSRSSLSSRRGDAQSQHQLQQQHHQYGSQQHGGQQQQQQREQQQREPRSPVPNAYPPAVGMKV
ncbi:hypothetical protein SCLCIDRAFT_1223782 [Scleroderma citrinum Foug A]|uniref:C2H2-type domain-containing protein n=1 Tax=Scleroderma citrinum Foug A TaxID=1036808 RepID=A0A0C3D8G2_9AGAM|nr:hypothetical protein SCLCIDRAFT_1223782 [Scleroderma citrinum Foug A]